MLSCSLYLSRMINYTLYYHVHKFILSLPTNTQDVNLNCCLREHEVLLLMSSLSVAAGTMLPRNLRTGGYDLPGVESSDVPLIGYRPLLSDSGTPSNQSRRGSGSDELETSQVSVFLSPQWNTSIIVSLECLTESDMKFISHSFVLCCLRTDNLRPSLFVFLLFTQ